MHPDLLDTDAGEIVPCVKRDWNNSLDESNLLPSKTPDNTLSHPNILSLFRYSYAYVSRLPLMPQPNQR